MEQIARTPRQLGKAIRLQRRSLKLNQSAVGSKTQLRQATISSVEAGEPGTQLRTVFDTLSALDLELVVRPRTRAATNDIADTY